MLEIALLDTRSSPATDLWQALLPQQSSFYSHLRSAKRRREYLYSRLLLNYLLRSYLSLKYLTERYVETDVGPRLLGKEYFISLSHSQGVMAVAISSQPLGLDIEYMKPRANLNELVCLFMNDDEKERFSDLPKTQQTKAFYRSWTAKEAIYKALVRSEQEHIGLSDIVIDQGAEIRPSLVVRTCLAGDYMLAVYVPEEKRAKI